ncbi:MAG: hypothetical protein AB7F50_00475 [Fimbriimonadaceae bacterium]
MDETPSPTHPEEMTHDASAEPVAQRPTPVAAAQEAGKLDALRRALGLTVIVLALLALVVAAMGMRASTMARAANLQGAKGVAAAASVGISSGDAVRLQGMAEWLVREGGYSSVAFFDTQGRVFASNVATEPPATPPEKLEPTYQSDGYWAPLRQGTGSEPWGWVRLTLAD